ncbi:hypothetical protein jhhlp_005470 [Lomentospora prolificans]|uniref:Stress-response A/B barrel domain-containing protein n=1 Tax=Lomentospora prolificans TaxID=41688 RepID=A0A2N3N715_9PEZI|nr:hypothetical protein jhhlp_005470 [Lomentospora prolificans]
MASKQIHRVTMFKIPSPVDQKRLIDLYRGLPDRALKDGKRYILSAAVGPTFDDARNQGYTLAAFTMFETEDDMKYYDEQCSEHAEIKKLARSLQIPKPMMVYFQNAL